MEAAGGTDAGRPGCSLGHLALHYGRPEDGPAAARLLRLLGLVETQVLLLPDGTTFHRFVVDGVHHRRADGIVYLSCAPAPQRALTAALREALGVGTAAEHPAVAGMRAMLDADPEASFHLGFLLSSLETLEEVMLGVQAAAADDPELAGRVRVRLNRARPGEPAVDARLDASPLFAEITRYAYGTGGVQAFVETDLLVAGALGEGMVLELDYVFPGRDRHLFSTVELEGEAA